MLDKLTGKMGYTKKKPLPPIEGDSDYVDSNLEDPIKPNVTGNKKDDEEKSNTE